MTGLGVDANVHSWDGGQLKPAIERYAALGRITWRVIIEKADWEPSQVGAPNVIDEDYYKGIYESPKMQDLWNTIAYIESFPGQTVSLSVMGGVSSWMGGSQILPDKEDFWVRMIASLLDYGRNQKHLTIKLISPFNEPDWNGIEGPKVGPAQATELLEKLSHRLDALGMGDVRFVVPDTASAAAAHDQYLPALLANPVVAAKIAQVGIHSYDGNAGSVPDLLAQSPERAAGVWATEFNSPCDGCDNGVEQADTWDHAFQMAHDLLSLIDQGVSGAQLYDAWDGYYEHHGAFGYWGALKYDKATGTYTPRRSFDVLSLLLAAIPPGSVHLVSSGAQAVDSEAFAGPLTGHVTVVGDNPTSSTQRFQIKVSGTAALSRAQLVTAGPGSAGSSTRPIAVDGSSLTVSVPANSVFAVEAEP
ncbi:glycosyl hydrolase [Sinomonas humi]|nr:glycosyl hydrolase [Sinomonas humi]